MGNKRLVPVGINLIDGRRIGEKELEEETYVVDKEEVVMNVNTSTCVFLNRVARRPSTLVEG